MEESGQPARKRGFPPVVNASTRILVLGSLPGDLSIASGQYYGNPRNAFWRLMSALTGNELVPLAYEQRLAALLAHGIGLWDVVAEAKRDGSLDTRIRDRLDNDLLVLASSLPNLSTIAFNGGTAARLGRKLIAAAQHRYRIVELPSTSPAHTMSFDMKLCAWRKLIARSEME